MGSKCWYEYKQNGDYKGEMNSGKYKNKKHTKSVRPEGTGGSIPNNGYVEYTIANDDDRRVCRKILYNSKPNWLIIFEQRYKKLEWNRLFVKKIDIFLFDSLVYITH